MAVASLQPPSVSCFLDVTDFSRALQIVYLMLPNFVLM